MPGPAPLRLNAQHEPTAEALPVWGNEGRWLAGPISALGLGQADSVSVVAGVSASVASEAWRRGREKPLLRPGSTSTEAPSI